MGTNSVSEIIDSIAKQGFLDAVGDSISIQDTNFKVLYQNRLHKNIAGDRTGEYCYRAYQGKDNVCDECHLAMTFSDGKIHKSEQSRTTDEGIRYYEISSSPLRNSEGEIIAGIEVVREITERKNVEKSLRARGRQLADSQKVARLGSWEWDIIDNRITGSDELYRIFGVEPDKFEATYESFLAMVHPDDRENLDKAVQGSMQKKKPYLMEARIFRSDGSEWVMEARGEVKYDESGNPLLMGGTAQDVTERTKAEAELHERIHLAELSADIGNALTKGGDLSEILQNCSDALVKHLDASFARIWAFNEPESVLELKASSGLYTYINGAHSRIPLGKYKIGMIARDRKPHLTNSVIGDPHVHDQEWAKKEKMVAFAGHPLIIEGRLAGVMALFSRKPLTEIVIKSLSSVADEIAIGIEHKKAEQDLHRYRMHLEELVKVRTGEITKVIEFLKHEIRERKQVEKELTENEKKFRLAFENARDVILWADIKTGILINCNKSAEQLFERSKSELLGTHQTMLHPPGKREYYSKLFKDQTKGEKSGIEAEVITASGEIKFVTITVSTTVVEGKEVIQGIFRDITEQKKLEKSLLEIEDRERQHIGYELHDSLGQLLTGISFKTKCLQNELKNRQIPEAEEAADIGSLINEAKIQAKMLAQGLSPIGTEGGGLMSALESLATNTQRLFNIRCSFTCPESVLLRNKKAILQLYRIAQEAVTNAVRHSQCKNIEIFLSRQDKSIIIKIKDDGTGVNKVSESNDGMGLKIMRYRASMIGASLGTEVKDGKGTAISCVFTDDINK